MRHRGSNTTSAAWSQGFVISGTTPRISEGEGGPPAPRCSTLSESPLQRGGQISLDRSPEARCRVATNDGILGGGEGFS